MPQDIPFEASKLLVFTPPSLEEIEGAPTFTIRTATWREKDTQRDMERNLRLKSFRREAIREETLRGLQAGWTDESYQRVAPALKNWWERLDDFELAKREDPTLIWDFDPLEEAVLKDHVDKIEQYWPPLAKMNAANEKWMEKSFEIRIAVMVKDWSGLDAKRELEAGYLTIESTLAMLDELLEFERKHKDEYGLVPDTAMFELYTACTRRFNLDEEEAKNSESPSPSGTAQQNSKPRNKPASSGKSPASASSRRTRRKG